MPQIELDVQFIVVLPPPPTTVSLSIIVKLEPELKQSLSVSEVKEIEREAGTITNG